jgi:hypothetical protein
MKHGMDLRGTSLPKVSVTRLADRFLHGGWLYVIVLEVTCPFRQGHNRGPGRIVGVKADLSSW